VSFTGNEPFLDAPDAEIHFTKKKRYRVSTIGAKKILQSTKYMPKHTIAQRNAEALDELRAEMVKLTAAVNNILSLLTKSATDSSWFLLESDKDDEHR
jgi:hypothetical protein